MICRSCGNLYFRKNKQKICLNCYTNRKRMDKLFFTVKQWKKFDLEKQEFLTFMYEVILTDWKSRREKLKYFLDTYPQYLDKGLKKMDKGFKMFDTVMAEFDKGMKSSMGSDKIDSAFIVGKAKKTDYSSLLFGSKTKDKIVF